MKLTVAFLFLFLLQINANTYSQNNKITLDVENTSIESILSRIEKETDFKFFFENSAAINLSKKMTLKVRKKRIATVLQILFANTNIRYEVLDKQIILTKRIAEAVQAKKPASPESVEIQDRKRQGVEITGTVLDKEGVPLPGASIVEKGTTNGTQSDFDGNFAIMVAGQDAVLVFSYVGFATQEIAIDSKTRINVTMSENFTSLDDVVVVGYSTERKRDLTGAVSVVELDDVKDVPASNPLQTLQGRVPGVYIQTTGAPSGESSVLVRGLNTLGNNDPLYVIDGVPTKSQSILRSINPNTIESMQVLKDASAASIYGSRASNGVIIVTTKEGEGKLRININNSTTFQNYFWQKFDVLNTEERGRALWQASINDGTDPDNQLYSYESHTDAQGNPVLDRVNPVEWIGGDPSSRTRSSDTNWQDVVYRTGSISQTDLNISGRSDQGSASLSLGYLSNKGVMRYTDFEKINVRMNSSYNFFDNKLKIGGNMLIAKTSETPQSTDLGGASITHLALWMQPILPVRTVDGEWSGPSGGGFSDRNNPLHMLYIHRNNKNIDKLLFGNIYAEYRPIDNLTFRSNIGLDYRNSRNKRIEPTYQTGFLARTTNSLDESLTELANWTWSNTLSYKLGINGQSFDFLLGTEAVHEDYTTLGAYREEFALQDDDYFYLSSGTGTQANSGTSTGYQLLSYFGKVNYTLLDKYLASVTLRYDGSSRFGEENRFGLFPAATIGWRINNEKFFSGIDFVSDLKLRIGVGRVGNQDIGNNARFGLYSTNYGTQSGLRNIGTAYDLSGANGGTLPSGYVATQTANPNLKWESTDEINFGLDFGLLQDRITGSLDYYKRNTKDILILPPYAAIMGEGGSRWENGATVENKGFEITMGYRDNVGDFSYGILGLLSSFQDKITYLPESVVRSYPGNVEKTILGHSQTSVFGYVTDGIFQNQGEVDAHAEQPGKDVGRIRYSDLNNDGKIDPLDQDWLGTTIPDFEYGINGQFGYKNFTLSLFIQGVQGKSIYNTNKYQLTSTFYNGMNFGTAVFDAWTPQNPDSDLPALSHVNTNNENRDSDFYYVNGSYLKLRTMQFSYDFPEKLLGRLKIEQLRINLIGENLFVIKDTKGKDRFFGTDPETSNLEYPRPTNISLGLSLTL